MRIRSRAVGFGRRVSTERGEEGRLQLVRGSEYTVEETLRWPCGVAG